MSQSNVLAGVLLEG